MTKSNLKILKLVNGDDLLVEIIASSSDVTFRNPVRIVVVPSKDPRAPSVGFAPWGEFSQDDAYSIEKSHILCIMAPIQEFANQYASMFGGIVTPSSKLIIPGK